MVIICWARKGWYLVEAILLLCQIKIECYIWCQHFRQAIFAKRPVPASQLKYLAPRICTCLRVPPCLWARLPFTQLHCKDQRRSTASWRNKQHFEPLAKFVRPGCDLWPRMWPFQVTMLLFLALHAGLTVVRALEEALPGRLSPLPQVGSWQVSSVVIKVCCWYLCNLVDFIKRKK